MSASYPSRFPRLPIRSHLRLRLAGARVVVLACGSDAQCVVVLACGSDACVVVLACGSDPGPSPIFSTCASRTRKAPDSPMTNFSSFPYLHEGICIALHASDWVAQPRIAPDSGAEIAQLGERPPEVSGSHSGRSLVQARVSQSFCSSSGRAVSFRLGAQSCGATRTPAGERRGLTPDALSCKNRFPPPRAMHHDSRAASLLSFLPREWSHVTAHKYLGENLRKDVRMCMQWIGGRRTHSKKNEREDDKHQE